MPDFQIHSTTNIGPAISIVIVNWNGEKFIEKCLNSVLKTDDLPYEVIVIDNASSDGSCDVIQRIGTQDKRVRLLKVAANLGFSAGNNVGVAHSKGEFVVLLNPDTEVDQGWLRSLLEQAESTNNSIVQSKLRIMNSNLLDGVGDFPTIHGLSLILGHRTKDGFPVEHEIFSARAAAMIIRRDTFIRLGGFDPDFFNGYEDVDLGWRHRLSGGQTLLAEKSIVYHVGRVFTNRKGTRESFHKHKNSISMVIKNYSLRNFLAIAPVTVAIRVLISCTPSPELREIMGSPVSSLKAVLWVLRNFRSIWSRHLRSEEHTSELQS